MFNEFDNELLDLDCPGCGHEFQEREGRLKDEPRIACPSCGAMLNLEQVRSTLLEFYKRIDEIGGR